MFSSFFCSHAGDRGPDLALGGAGSPQPSRPPGPCLQVLQASLLTVLAWDLAPGGSMALKPSVRLLRPMSCHLRHRGGTTRTSLCTWENASGCQGFHCSCNILEGL